MLADTPDAMKYVSDTMCGFNAIRCLSEYRLAVRDGRNASRGLRQLEEFGYTQDCKLVGPDARLHDASAEIRER